MSFQKIDLQDDAWIKEIFQSRNQAYGAFQLRKNHSRNSFMGLGISLSFMILSMIIPLSWKGKAVPLIGPVVSRDTTVVKLQEIYKDKEIRPKTQVNLVSHPKPSTNITNPEIVKNVVEIKHPLESTESLSGKELGTPNNDPGKGSPGIPDNPNTVPEDNDGKTVLVADEPCAYPGGFDALYSDVNNYLKGHYPQEALDIGAQGKVVLNFIVERDGSVSNIQIISGKNIKGGLPEIAVKAVERLKRFKPGKNHGIPVRQYFSFPINFQIQNQEE